MMEGGEGWSCRDSMTARNNVALELCGRLALPEGQVVIMQISDKIGAVS